MDVWQATSVKDLLTDPKYILTSHLSTGTELRHSPVLGQKLDAASLSIVWPDIRHGQLNYVSRKKKK